MEELTLELTDRDSELMSKVAQFLGAKLEELALRGLQSRIEMALDDDELWAFCGFAKRPIRLEDFPWTTQYDPESGRLPR